MYFTSQEKTPLSRKVNYMDSFKRNYIHFSILFFLLIMFIIFLFKGDSHGQELMIKAPIAQGVSKGHTVTLTWKYSKPQPLKFQFVFRQIGCVGKFVQRAQLSPTTSIWIDSSVATKTTYCYCLTAQGTSKVISSPSNVVKTTVP